MSEIPKRLYLAGPMSGVAAHNFPEFHRVAGLLRRQGYEVFNPAENDDGSTRRPRAFYMRLDIPALMASEGVVLLPGWHESRGASLEVWIAIDLGLPLFRPETANGAVVLSPVQGVELARLPFTGDRP